MVIANPIYDTVFKYLMEDLDIAKGGQTDNPLIEKILNRLIRAISDDNLKRQMNVEDEIETEWQEMSQRIAEKDKTIEEKNKQNEEKDKTIEEKNKQNEEKDKTIEKKNKQNAELLRKIEELTKQIKK